MQYALKFPTVHTQHRHVAVLAYLFDRYFSRFAIIMQTLFAIANAFTHRSKEILFHFNFTFRSQPVGPSYAVAIVTGRRWVARYK